MFVLKINMKIMIGCRGVNNLFLLLFLKKGSISNNHYSIKDNAREQILLKIRWLIWSVLAKKPIFSY